MNVFIFIEHIMREGTSTYELKKEFEKKGFKVWVFSIIFELTKAKVVSLKNIPDIVFLPWFVNEKHESIIYTIIKNNPNVKIINLHQEQIGSISTEKTLIPITQFTKNGCYHFAWGRYFYNKLLENNVDKDKVFITGNIRNDASIGKKSIDRLELAQKYGLDISKKWILFAENRGWILMHNDIATINELEERGMNEKDINDFIDYTKKSLNLFEDNIKTLDKSFFNEFEFIYRPHPGTILFNNLGENVKIIPQNSIYDWIMNCDLFVTCESTSIFEAEMCNKPCLTIDWVNSPNNLKMAGISEYEHINKLEEINLELIDKLSNNSKNYKNYEKYCGKVDGNSVKRVVETTLKLIEQETNIFNYRIQKRKLIAHIKQFIYEVITYIFAKIKLLYIIKKPRTAYIESRDIPYIKSNWGK